MSIRRALTVSLFTSALAVPAVALADAPNEPCQGLEPGAACVTFDGEDGTCQELPSGFVDCVPNGETTTAASSTASAGSTTATTGGGTTTASGATTGAGATTGGGSTTGGSGGGAGSGGSDGGGTTEEDDGCAVRAPSSKVAGRAGAALVFAAAVLGTLRRWRRRRAA